MIKYNLNFYKASWIILILGLYSSNVQSQDTPIGNKIVGNGDPVNYYIGHFPVSGSDGLDLHWYGGIRFGDRTSNSVMQITNGNVGIGTTSPAAKLDIVGDIYIDNLDWSTDNALRIREGSSNTYGAFFKYGLNDLLTIGTRHNDLDYTAFQVPRGSTNVTFNGNVGIGTTNPRANLDMAKDISNGQLGTVFGRLPEGDGTGLGTYLGVKGYATQGTDPYNVKSFSIVHDFYGQTNNSINFYRGGGMLGGFMTFSTSDNTEKMRIGTNGYVGIGSTNPDSKLTVKGKIHAEEVKVDLAVPADYVFEKYYLGKSSLKPDYTLLTLSAVEKFTEENHHLPNVPSAKEIKINGLLLGEMSNILLQKIEELTLYMIEQNKKLEMQQTENTKQSKEIIKLKEAKEYYKAIAERVSKLESQLKNQN